MAEAPSSSHGMQPLSSNTSSDMSVDRKANSRLLARADSDPQRGHVASEDGVPAREYRVYSARFFGLAQLALLNIVISWDWLTFAAVSDTAADFFDVAESSINWLSTAFLFAFVVASPAAIYVLNRYGPKASILAASGLALVGNWLRYAGTRTGAHGSFGLVMVGQVMIGLAQPFVLAAPTRYSSLWFSDSGRVSATAVASLANPFGGALGQLIGPLWAGNASRVPNMVLYTAIVSSAAAIPAPFIPAEPPSPPSATAESEKLDLRQAFRELPRNGSFYLLLIPFSVYVGLFNSTSSLLNQILEPYGFSETDAGIAGGLLILVGLIASAVVSPLVDRTKRYLLFTKVLVPCVAACYVALIFMPGTRTIAGPYIVCSLLGAFSFSLLPMALELLSIVTLPVGPEVSGVIAWAGGQALGAIFILIVDALEGGWKGEPKETRLRGLIFSAVIACLIVPFPMFIGIWKFRRIVVGPEGVGSISARS